MIKMVFTLLTVLVFQTYLSAQKEGIASIRKKNMKAGMMFFSSDQLQGRELGTEANEIAALYIRSGIMGLGLKPAVNNYFQDIPLVSHKNQIKESHLRISGINGDLVYSTDSLLQLATGGNTLEAQAGIVFAGYGFEDEKSGYSDLKDVDLKDKIVLLMTRTPELARSNTGEGDLDFSVESNKISGVLKKGAKAILLVFDPRNKLQDPFKSDYYEYFADSRVSLAGSSLQASPFIIGLIRPDVADFILRTTGKTLSQYQSEINSSGMPVSTEIKGITVSLQAVVKTEKFSGKNVIGLIEGSDPVLKNECILYTAHFDHVGEDRDGNVFNGADDNASGAMGLMEVARAFMNLKKKPLRSVVFAWVNGEEKGLLGSEYYVNNPVIPLEKTLLDINLDMIGRSKMASDTGKFFGFTMNVTQPGEVLLYSKHESTGLMKTLSSAAEKTGIKLTDMGADIEAGGSDHESFWAKGVPALMFHTGIHSDLHKISDDEEKIDYDKMELISKFVFQLGYNVANQKERFKVEKAPNR